MNPEIASLIIDLDLSLYSYEKASFFQAHKFEVTFELGALTSMESFEAFSSGDWAASVSTGSIRRFGTGASEISSISDKIFSGLFAESQRRENFHRKRIAENHYRLRYRPSNCFVGLFDRVPHQLDLFEDGTT